MSGVERVELAVVSGGRPASPRPGGARALSLRPPAKRVQYASCTGDEDDARKEEMIVLSECAGRTCVEELGDDDGNDSEYEGGGNAEPEVPPAARQRRRFGGSVAT